MERRPERLGEARRAALHQHGEALATGRLFHRLDEWADRLHVVADVGDERDVGRERALERAEAGGGRPPRLDDVDVVDRVLRHRLAEGPEHRCRWIEGDHPPDRSGERQRIPTRPGADVKPCVI